MKVKPLTVGPIVGSTTGSSVRIWGRGEYEKTRSGPRRCFGVARTRKVDTSQFRDPRFFKMNPNFDMTGIAVFDNLEPETKYKYQIGSFFSDRA